MYLKNYTTPRHAAQVSCIFWRPLLSSGCSSLPLGNWHCVFVKTIIQMAFLLCNTSNMSCCFLNEQVVFGCPNYSRSRKESVQTVFLLQFVFGRACKITFSREKSKFFWNQKCFGLNKIVNQFNRNPNMSLQITLCLYEIPATLSAATWLNVTVVSFNSVTGRGEESLCHPRSGAVGWNRPLCCSLEKGVRTCWFERFWAAHTPRLFTCITWKQPLFSSLCDPRVPLLLC